MYQQNAAANSLGLAGRTGLLIVCLFSPVWSNAVGNKHVYAATKSLVGVIEDVAHSLDAYNPYIYLDYSAD